MLNIRSRRIMRSEHTEFPQETRKELLRIWAGERGVETGRDGGFKNKTKQFNFNFISTQEVTSSYSWD